MKLLKRIEAYSPEILHVSVRHTQAEVSWFNSVANGEHDAYGFRQGEAGNLAAVFTVPYQPKPFGDSRLAGTFPAEAETRVRAKFEELDTDPGTLSWLGKLTVEQAAEFAQTLEAAFAAAGIRVDVDH